MHAGTLWLSSLPQLQDISALSNLQFEWEPNQNLEWDDITIRYCPRLPNLDGLEQVQSVSRLTIEGNDSLQNMGGLKNMQVAEEIKVEKNNSLQNIGFNGLNYVEGLFHIKDNEGMKEIVGLLNLDSIGSMGIENNDSLLSIQGLGNLTSANLISVYNNHALQSFDGVQTIQSVNLIGFTGNYLAQGDLFLPFIDSITSLTFTHNYAAEAVKCPNLNAIGVGVFIWTTPIKEIDFGENIRTFRRILHVSFADSLEALSFHGNFTKTDSIVLLFNPSLKTVEGMEGLENLKRLRLSENPQLTSCSAFCNVFQNGTVNIVSISGTPAPCDTEANILLYCDTLTLPSALHEPELENAPALLAYPNPAIDEISLLFRSNGTMEDAFIEISDLLGKSIGRFPVARTGVEGWHGSVISLHAYPAGLYVATLWGNGQPLSILFQKAVR